MEEQLFGVQSSGRIGHGSTWRSSARIAHGAIMLGYTIFLKMFKHGYLMGGGFWGQNSKFSGISDLFLVKGGRGGAGLVLNSKFSGILDSFAGGNLRKHF